MVQLHADHLPSTLYRRLSIAVFLWISSAERAHQCTACEAVGGQEAGALAW